MWIRAFIMLAAAGSALAACSEQRSGPLVVSAIGDPPKLTNPNLRPLSPPSAILNTSVAQGLVRLDQAGQIEPALAQSWTVSDDGLSYIFRIARLQWPDGSDITTEQVAARLRAAASPASRNRLKPLLGSIDEVVRMTDRVIEVRLKGPRPNFLQLLAQPEMAIIWEGQGSGPLVAEPASNGAIRLRPRVDSAEPDAEGEEDITILLRGEPAPLALARFESGLADLVTGGGIAELPYLRAADLPAGQIRYDPVAGLFGLAFMPSSGPLGEAEVRQALSMAVDREGWIGSLGVPGAAPRLTIAPAGIPELNEPAAPSWAGLPLPERRRIATEIIGRIVGEEPLTVRVSMPNAPGYRLLFAHLRRDWRAIGLEVERVEPSAAADLQLIDEVAPATFVTWYLRRFGCDQRTVCSPEVDRLLASAREAQAPAERRALLAEADRLLADVAPYIPLAAPVRWSAVSQRLTAFQPNGFGSRYLGGMVAGRR